MGKGRCLLAYFICCGAPRLKNNSAMKTTIDRSLIISLIKDDLIHAKLINGLMAIGLDATHYHLYLGETILQLMGMDHERLTYFANGRNFRLTDVAGEVVRDIMA